MTKTQDTVPKPDPDMKQEDLDKAFQGLSIQETGESAAKRSIIDNINTWIDKEENILKEINENIARATVDQRNHALEMDAIEEKIKNLHDNTLGVNTDNLNSVAHVEMNHLLLRFYAIHNRHPECKEVLRWIKAKRDAELFIRLLDGQKAKVLADSD